MTREKKDKGDRGEERAAAFLEAQGYRILERNYRCPLGEVDLIARDGATVVFVEVKARPTMAEAAMSISTTKRERMSRAARHWLARHPWAINRTLRGDGLFIAPFRMPRHVPAAVELELD